MLLIATDEAGYGPKLGPLVIAATAWRIEDDVIDHELPRLFAPLGRPVTVSGRTVFVDDSKKVFKPTDTLDVLHTIASASIQWLGWDASDLSSLLPRIAPDDVASIEQTPWLRHLSTEAFLSPSLTKPLIERWSEQGIRLSDLRVRVITARKFNEVCNDGRNKADLLSESTLDLVEALARDSGEAKISVYCDRHGGRRYYGGVLQHVFSDDTLRVVAESKHESRYELARENRSVDVRFTVKGDSFAPVALSSMHAKYLRERMMESMNVFFAERHNAGEPLRRTAGYPVDADRFLDDIAPIIESAGIQRSDLVRAR